MAYQESIPMTAAAVNSGAIMRTVTGLLLDRGHRLRHGSPRTQLGGFATATDPDGRRPTRRVPVNYRAVSGCGGSSKVWRRTRRRTGLRR